MNVILITMRTTLLSLFLVAVAPVFGFDDSTVKLLKKHVQTSRDFTIAVAKQMPDDQYAFKLTPEQMSFGEQMVHIANANGFFFGKMTGSNGPAVDPKKPITKEIAVAALEKAYSFALEKLGSVDDAKLKDMVDTGDGKMTMLEGVMLLLDHSTNHRASAEMYLRVKGIKPTDYRF